VWHFERISANGGAVGSSYRNVLATYEGLSPEAKLAREAIQNSCDASRRDRGDSEAGPVRIVFHKRSLTGDQKCKFTKVLELGNGPGARLPELRLPPENSFGQIDDPDAPLHLMIIEDWGTVGLGGPVPASGPDAHYWRLLFTVGDDQKAWADGQSGGSFGYGKAVYSSTAVRLHLSHTQLSRAQRPENRPVRDFWDADFMSSTRSTARCSRGGHGMQAALRITALSALSPETMLTP
jgi:hypothetical protein